MNPHAKLHEKSCANCKYLQIAPQGLPPPAPQQFFGRCQAFNKNFDWVGPYHFVNGQARGYTCEEWKKAEENWRTQVPGPAI